MTGFGERLRAGVAEHGHLCVGIDPHESLLGEWGLDASAAGAREFGLRVVEASAGRVAVVKPQVAFFERYGAAGFIALERVLAEARSAGLVVIADAKRGDIGSTMDAYARAWLTPGSTLEADALTVSPYLGVGSLVETMRLATGTGKGLFVLAATSNPEAGALQSARLDTPDSEDRPTTVAGHVVEEVAAFNAATSAPGEWGSIGLVVGATVRLADRGVSASMAPLAPILAPGFGHQGASLAALDTIFGELSPAVLASESRGILSGGREGLTERIDARKRELPAVAHG